MKGFAPEWCRMISQYVQGGSVGVKVNDDIGHYFQTKKGLRQGDPLSPILFNIVVDMLAIIIERAKNNDQVGGLIPHLVEGGSLSYNMLMILSCSWNMISIKP
jgi:retron-type reverse transcriptase